MLQPELFTRMLVRGRRRLPPWRVGIVGDAGRGLIPLLFKVDGGGLNRVFNISGSTLHRFLHFFEFFQIHRAIDLSLDIRDVALSLAQEVAHGPRHARQLLGADDDERHHPDEGYFGNTKIDQIRTLS